MNAASIITPGQAAQELTVTAKVIRGIVFFLLVLAAMTVGWVWHCAQ